MGEPISFDVLGLSEALLAAVANSGYQEPTPVQRQAIPVVLQGRDVLAIAQTGTGKTASFVLPMLDILGNGRSRARIPRSLILEPTRELAVQVAENFDKYGSNHKLTKALLIGGVAFGDQDKALEKGVDVLIATPGRLLDHVERGKILMSGIEILVIDEADRMLDMGFIPDVERICTFLPARHQTLFFSATMPAPIKKLADRFLKEPKTIEVSKPATAGASISQSVVLVAEREKRDTLCALLQEEQVTTAIIFCNRKRDVKAVYDILKRAGFNAAQLHGDMEQSERLVVMERFKAGALSVLVASDVAARGLDISQVSHVFNYDVPLHGDDYVHRIGRTGRAGRAGTAVMLVTPADREYLQGIEALIGQTIAQRAKPAALGSAQNKPITALGSAQNKPITALGSAQNKPTTALGSAQSMEPGDDLAMPEWLVPTKAKPAAKSKAKSRKNQSAKEQNAKEPSTSAPNRKTAKPKDPVRQENSAREDDFVLDALNLAEDMPCAFGLGSHVPAFFLVSARSA